MIQGITIWLLTLLLTYFIVGLLEQRHAVLNRRFALNLFFYHSLLAVVYYLYAASNPSDSHNYYIKSVSRAYGDDLFDYFGISTQFVDFISFFLIGKLGFTYESGMAFFAWLGYLGFLFFYIFFKERIRSSPKVFGVDGILLLFLLPNPHFWSSSIGKGSLIFFGFGLFFYGINKPGIRFWAILLGGWIIFQLRPHIFYVILVAVALGYTFSTKGGNIVYRLVILAVASFLLYYIYEDIVQLTGLEDDFILDPLFSHRAQELSKATSGIDIANYSIPEKLFAFWFRPLFFDAPGLLGIIVSFENLFYLIFFVRVLTPKGLRFVIASDAIVKTCLLTFLGVSLALAQISGNLGLAMRQKSQVMMLMLFVLLKFIDVENVAKLKARYLSIRPKNRLVHKVASSTNP